MKCKSCNGLGMIKCTECKGEGIHYGMQKCEQCSGDGNVACSDCNGKGKVSFFSKFVGG